LAKLRISKDHSHDPFMNVPPDIAPPSQVRVFISDFDNDGFLTFHSINSDGNAENLAINSQDTARNAYRKLWKEELTEPNMADPLKNSDRNLENISEEIEFKNAAIRAIEEARAAIKQLNLLSIIANDPTRPGSELASVSENLSKIDRNLEELSLTFPILGTIVRIFIIDKENLRGEDIFLLTEKTVQLYEELIRRLHNFTRYFAEYQSIFLDKGEIEHDSNQSR